MSRKLEDITFINNHKKSFESYPGSKAYQGWEGKFVPCELADYIAPIPLERTYRYGDIISNFPLPEVSSKEEKKKFSQPGRYIPKPGSDQLLR